MDVVVVLLFVAVGLAGFGLLAAAAGPATTSGSAAAGNHPSTPRPTDRSTPTRPACSSAVAAARSHPSARAAAPPAGRFSN
jgi:hypothetical protein